MGPRFNEYLGHFNHKRRKTRTSGLYSRKVTTLKIKGYGFIPISAIGYSRENADLLGENIDLLPLTRPCLSGNLVLDNLCRHSFTLSRHPDRTIVSVGNLDPKKANFRHPPRIVAERISYDRWLNSKE